jgi:gliding motility-associated-like protein
MKLLALLILLAGSINSLPAQEISISQKEITPNADGINDFLKIENIAAYRDNRVTILNRWGKKVFEIWDYDNKENKFIGRANTPVAEDLPSGKYYYTVALNDGSNNIEGDFVLRR